MEITIFRSCINFNETNFISTQKGVPTDDKNDPK